MILPTLFALTLQAAAPPTGDVSRFSILVPTPSERCTRKPPSPPPGQPAHEDDIVVCGDPLPSQAVPYTDEIVPNRPMPSNADLSGTGAARASVTPCAARQGGCAGGVGFNPVPLALGAAKLVGDAFRKKSDKTGRVAIPLNDPVPGPVPDPVPGHAQR